MTEMVNDLPLKALERTLTYLLGFVTACYYLLKDIYNRAKS